MINRTKLFVSIRFIFILLCMPYAQPPLWAGNSELPPVKVAMSDDQSVIVGRILYTALKRSGYQMVSKVTGMRTSIADVNYGDAAILPSQTDGWDIQYPNLIKVPVPIDYVEFTTFVRSEDSYRFSTWSDIAGLRLCYRWQNQYVANNVPRAEAGKLVTVNELQEVWSSLLNNEADVAVLPRIKNYEFILPKGIKKADVIDRQACYSYVNRDYAFLAPLLEKAYQEMTDDGTLDSIQNSHKVYGDKQVILHINSHNAQNEWERSRMESIRRNLEEKTTLEYYSFNLNSNEFSSRANYNSIVSELIRIYTVARYPDLIIASGNEALEYVLSNYFLLFPKVPVVFFGVNGFNNSMLYGVEQYITGVPEKVSFYETASEMLRLYPRTRRIFILNDNTLSKSIKFRREIQTGIESCDLPVKFEFNENKPLPEILNDIHAFDSDTLVLIGNYLSDSNGTFYSETDVQKLVSEASGNPVFCLSSPYIGYGTLGGLLSSTDDQSKIATSMAVEILKGMPPEALPVIQDSASLNQWHFDYKTAREYNLNVHTLPAGHIIVNRVLPVWKTNPLEFKLALAVAVMLLLIIVALIVSLKMQARKQAAEAALVAKSAFLANMSHEIRTPMNSIIGFSELALDGEITPATREYLSMIEENAKGLLQIINDILDLSKVESGNVKLECLPFDLHELLKSCRSIIMPRSIKKNLDLQFYAESSIRKNLLGDTTRLRQVLINLLSNAVKFTESGAVKVAVVVKNETEKDVTLRFEISDSGIGMTREQITRIFEPFSQADISTTRKYGGTGLGMTITKNILDLMGSELEIKSEPGAGTAIAFELTFDTIDKTNEVIETDNTVEEISRPSFEGEVLVCEDNLMNQWVITEHLARVGIKAEIAENGLEGINKVRVRMNNNMKPFDLILMDIHMPIMDGLEAASKIIALKTGTPIVAMTANIMTEDRERYKKIGMIDYVGKPFTSLELWRCLLKYLKPVSAANTENDEKEDSGKKLYAKLESDFVKINQTKFDEIENAVNTGNINLAHRLAHTLKSNAAQIGKSALKEAAAEVEAAFKDGENKVSETQMETLRTELSSVLVDLRPYLAEAADQVQPEETIAYFDIERARKLIEKLDPLLKSGNPESLKMIDKLKVIPKSGELIKHMENFRFIAAENALEELKKELEAPQWTA